MSEARWIKFDTTCDYEGNQTGPAIVDASRAITVEARTLGSMSIVNTLFSTKVNKNKTPCVEVCFDSGLSIYVLWDFEHICKALGIELPR